MSSQYLTANVRFSLVSINLFEYTDWNCSYRNVMLNIRTLFKAAKFCDKHNYI